MKKKRTVAEVGRAVSRAHRRAREPVAPKMGRPRTGEDIRIARGVRLGPDLLSRVDAIIRDKRADGVDTFTAAVERALVYWVAGVNTGAPGAVRDYGIPAASEERARR